MAGRSLAGALLVAVAKLGAGFLRQRGELRDDVGMFGGNFLPFRHVMPHVVEFERLRRRVLLRRAEAVFGFQGKIQFPIAGATAWSWVIW